MTEYTTISIPKELQEDVQAFIEDTNFTSVSEFARHLLRDTIAGGDLNTGSELSQDEVQQVRDRLEELGYLDGSPDRRSNDHPKEDRDLE